MMGLRGKFVVALVIAAVLPLLVGVIVLHTIGFRYLLAERGRAHAAEARNLAGSFEQAVEGQAMSLRSWIAADGALTELATGRNEASAGQDPAERQAATKAIDAAWAGAGEDEPRVRAVLDNPAAASLRTFVERHPLVAEVLATDSFGRVIAASRKTSDYDQADEAWWVTGSKLDVDAAWSDALHLDRSAEVYSIDMVMPLHTGGRFAGVIKMVIDATPLFGGIATRREDVVERLEVMLPDARILTRHGNGDYPLLSSTIDNETMLCIFVGANGWTVSSRDDGDDWMVGFAGIRPPGRTRKEGPSGYVLISTREGTVVAPVRRQLLWVAVAAGLAVAVCALAGYKFTSRKILRPLKVLREAARAVSETARLRESDEGGGGQVADRRARAGRELEQMRKIQTGDEVEELSRDLTVMTERVLRYHQEMEAEVAAKTALIHDDLGMAREFQNAMMPAEYPELPTAGSASPLRLEFGHFYQSSETLGGDFFDMIKLDDCRVGILIADVMGHGARSALVTAIVQALERNRAKSVGDPGAFLGEINGHLYELISRSGQVLFVTAFLMVIDTRQGRADWAVAGHPAPLRGRRGADALPQPLWREPQGQPALGLMEEVSYRTQREELSPGDVFLLFTDGAFEAEDPAGVEFGPERLAASFAKALRGPLTELPGRIIGEVSVHIGGVKFEDDICLVAVEALANESSGT